jgi:hypothetical protein
MTLALGRGQEVPNFPKEHMPLHIQPNTVYKRKFRWTIEGKFPGGEIEQHFIKVAARPELTIEEVELTGIKFPASQKWQSIAVTSYDTPKQMYSALAESYFETPNECPTEKKGTVTLRLYDGCGWLLESWELNGHTSRKLRSQSTTLKTWNLRFSTIVPNTPQKKNSHRYRLT